MNLVVTGPVHGGKTTFLERRLPVWIAGGLACAGFLSPAVVAAGEAAGYDLLEIATGRRLHYLRVRGDREAERVGPYVFVPETLERARAIIREAGPSGLLVVDEIGPLELAGGGLRDALDAALPRRTGPNLLVVREGLVAEAAGRLSPPPAAVYDIREPGAAARLDERLLGKVGSP